MFIFFFFFFFFNDTATTEIYTTVHTLSLHDALPILAHRGRRGCLRPGRSHPNRRSEEHTSELQSRTVISYAVFCLKKKKKKRNKKTITLIYRTNVVSLYPVAT